MNTHFLAATSLAPSSFNTPCISETYFGNYGGQHIYMPTQACVDTSAHLFHPEDVLKALPESTQQIIWIQERSVEDSVRRSTAQGEFNFDDFLTKLHSQAADGLYDASNTQISLSTPAERGTLLAVWAPQNSDALTLIPVDASAVPTLDIVLPPFYKPIALPQHPIPASPVNKISLAPVTEVLANLKFSKDIAAIVNNISVAQMDNDIRYLTGEDGTSGIMTRHSFSQGALAAAEWIAHTLNETGAACEQRRFLFGFAPNVICRYPATSNTTATVLFSAHYDSRGSFGNTRAPGGDDDGSGTTAILSIGRTIARLGIQFHSNVELVLFAGEEQGLYGSRAYSRELRAAKSNLTLMIQADMLAYHVPGEPLQLGLPDRIGSPEVAQLITKISELYSPELTVGFTSACCSDHQPFHEQGFPASQVFERAGPIADPMYHNSGDFSERVGYDLEQVRSIAKVQFATLLHATGFDLPE